MREKGIEKRMPNPIKNKSGITLIEVIVVVLLLAVLIGAGIVPYILQQELLKKQFERSRLQDDISVALNFIGKDIFRAQEIDRTTASELTITIPTDPANPATVDTIVYKLTGANNGIIRDLNGTESNIIIDSDTVNPASYALQFTGSDNNFVTATITGTKKGQTIIESTGIALRATSAK